ncbi:hypothetical protein H696_04619 [Fonticula alba]|uniref:Mic1 domain-containing protein n=1 Tax=Fonticula alba TaxID=691883 RepID=A0A058Z6P9_FONAL|nr:hypothetical protein H696_04619 [Fonticula alba]KCV69207.1 hypothetical protein H696_04619 [Fonticula alba]|eukprot:XP_009496778.1 hypothetical protein H696_04619 [Fonticula alba]
MSLSSPLVVLASMLTQPPQDDPTRVPLTKLTPDQLEQRLLYKSYVQICSTTGSPADSPVLAPGSPVDGEAAPPDHHGHYYQQQQQQQQQQQYQEQYPPGNVDSSCVGSQVAAPGHLPQERPFFIGPGRVLLNIDGFSSMTERPVASATPPVQVAVFAECRSHRDSFIEHLADWQESVSQCNSPALVPGSPTLMPPSSSSAAVKSLPSSDSLCPIKFPCDWNTLVTVRLDTGAQYRFQQDKLFRNLLCYSPSLSGRRMALVRSMDLELSRFSIRRTLACHMLEIHRAQEGTPDGRASAEPLRCLVSPTNSHPSLSHPDLPRMFLPIQRNAKLLGLFWHTEQLLCLVTDTGLFMLEPSANGKDLTVFSKKQPFPLQANWFKYNHDAHLLMLASGELSNVISFFFIQQGKITPLPPLTLEVPPAQAKGQRSADRSVLPDELTIALLYNSIYLIYMRRRDLIVFRVTLNECKQIISFPVVQQGPLSQPGSLDTFQTGQAHHLHPEPMSPGWAPARAINSDLSTMSLSARASSTFASLDLPGSGQAAGFGPGGEEDIPNAASGDGHLLSSVDSAWKRLWDLPPCSAFAGNLIPDPDLGIKIIPSLGLISDTSGASSPGLSRSPLSISLVDNLICVHNPERQSAILLDVRTFSAHNFMLDTESLGFVPATTPGQAHPRENPNLQPGVFAPQIYNSVLRFFVPNIILSKSCLWRLSIHLPRFHLTFDQFHCYAEEFPPIKVLLEFLLRRANSRPYVINLLRHYITQNVRLEVIGELFDLINYVAQQYYHENALRRAVHTVNQRMESSLPRAPQLPAQPSPSQQSALLTAHTPDIPSPLSMSSGGSRSGSGGGSGSGSASGLPGSSTSPFRSGSGSGAGTAMPSGRPIQFMPSPFGGPGSPVQRRSLSTIGRSISRNSTLLSEPTTPTPSTNGNHSSPAGGEVSPSPSLSPSPSRSPTAAQLVARQRVSPAGGPVGFLTPEKGSSVLSLNLHAEPPSPSSQTIASDLRLVAQGVGDLTSSNVTRAISSGVTPLPNPVASLIASDLESGPQPPSPFDEPVVETRNLEGSLVLSQEDLFRDVLRFLDTEAGGAGQMADPVAEQRRTTFYAAVLLELNRSLRTHNLTIEHSTSLALLDALVRSGQMNELTQMLQYMALPDSEPLAGRLLSLAPRHRPLFQMALDIYNRLGRQDLIIQVLIAKGRLAEALRFAVKHAHRLFPNQLDPKGVVAGYFGGEPLALSTTSLGESLPQISFNPCILLDAAVAAIAEAREDLQRFRQFEAAERAAMLAGEPLPPAPVPPAPAPGADPVTPDAAARLLNPMVLKRALMDAEMVFFNAWEFTERLALSNPSIALQLKVYKNYEQMVKEIFSPRPSS